MAVKKIDYSWLRIGDLVHCTSLSPVACGIRVREAGVKNTFNTSISTHTGIVFKTFVEGMIGIMEMKPDGLKFNSFSNYLSQGWAGPRIISITRSVFQFDPNKYSNLLLRLWKEGKNYDIGGCLKWALPFMKDKDSSFYCSELAEFMALKCGFSYYRDLGNVENFDEALAIPDDVMPSTLQKSKYMGKVI
jgi:hypothetical protein